LTVIATRAKAHNKRVRQAKKKYQKRFGSWQEHNKSKNIFLFCTLPQFQLWVELVFLNTKDLIIQRL
jgi:hypothetical protein